MSDSLGICLLCGHDCRNAFLGPSYDALLNAVTRFVPLINQNVCKQRLCQASFALLPADRNEFVCFVLGSGGLPGDAFVVATFFYVLLPCIKFWSLHNSQWDSEFAHLYVDSAVTDATLDLSVTTYADDTLRRLLLPTLHATRKHVGIHQVVNYAFEKISNNTAQFIRDLQGSGIEQNIEKL